MLLIKVWAIIAALLGFLAVAMGAFAGHLLRGSLTHESEKVFHTALQYHFLHVFAIFAAAWLSTQFTGTLVYWAGWLFIGGVLLFSGSLYALALTNIRYIGYVTPIGGTALLIAWLLLALAIWRSSI